MPWFCWIIIGAFGSYIIFLFLGFLFSRKRSQQKELEQEEDTDIIIYEDVQLFIFARKGDQIQTIWDFSQYAQKNVVAVQVTYDEMVINMLPEEMREVFESDEEWSWTVLPHATVWQQGEVFRWLME